MATSATPSLELGQNRRRTRVPSYTLAAAAVGVIEKINPFEAAERAERRKARGGSGEVQMERVLSTVCVGDELTIKLGLNRKEVLAAAAATAASGLPGSGVQTAASQSEGEQQKGQQQEGQEEKAASLGGGGGGGGGDSGDVQHATEASEDLLDLPSFLGARGRWPGGTASSLSASLARAVRLPPTPAATSTTAGRRCLWWSR